MTDLQRPQLIKKEGITIPGAVLIELIKAVLEKNKSFRFRANGFSMSPFVKNGDIITISPLQNSPFRPGDIVAFFHPVTGKPFVHRVIWKKGSSLRIRGDSLLSDDGLIPESNIFGKVTKVERDGENIYLGLGIEKYLIALLSGKSLLRGLLHKLSHIRRIAKNAIKRLPHEKTISFL